MNNNRRKNTRFIPDPNTIVEIDVDVNGDNFSPSIKGIVTSESYGGCAIAVQSGVNIKDQQIINVKVGDLAPMSAKIVWVKELDSDINKFGLKFLE